MKRVFLEGPIAVGKSAAMEQIALDEELWSVSQEPLQKLEGRRLMDGTFREFLKPYYWQRSPENSRLMQVAGARDNADQSLVHLLPFQTSALLAFLERFEEEGDVRPGCPVRIYERSLASSRDVFLQALELPSVDRTLLYELTSWGIRTFEAGALRVYLDAVPDVLAERFYRRNRPSESGMR